jgi:MoaA/NifB/PqqE/SkfB family radical SAM enzyme
VTCHPFEIVVDVTNRCNLRCPLCATGQRLNDRPTGEIALEDFKRVIDELAPYLFKARLHSWGEPTLHRGLVDMLAYLTEKNIGSEISSNLTLFRPEDAFRLVDSGLELLIVSMDGTTQDVYETYRRGARLERVQENLRAIAAAKKARRARTPVIEVQFLLMKHNLHQADDIRRVARELGADRCRTFPIVLNIRNEEQRARWLPGDRRLSRYDPDTLEDRFYSLNRACPWLWQSAVINWDGTVSPCCIYEGRKADLGENVFRDGFRAAWNGRKYRLARETFALRRQTPLPAGEFNICRFCRGRPRPSRPDQQGIY